MMATAQAPRCMEFLRSPDRVAAGLSLFAGAWGMDIVWTPETVSALFKVGPATYRPCTRMPEQTIGDAGDRAALIRFLRRATTD